MEKFLTTKRSSRTLLFYYLLCRSLTLVTLLCACTYLGYYLRMASVTDDFGCALRVGLLENDSYIPDKVQCKLIAVGVFSLLRYCGGEAPCLLDSNTFTTTAFVFPLPASST